MATTISPLLALAVGLVGSIGALSPVFILRRALGATGGVAEDALNAKILQIDEELERFVGDGHQFSSSLQVTTVETQIDELKAAILAEQQNLKGVEEKLDGAQSNVQGKERQQQEVKNSKEEDEKKLAGLLDGFNELTGVSVALEQNLAKSLKEIDQLLVTLELNPDQKLFLQELSDVLVNAGGRLRDLIMEYEGVNTRLSGLNTQHNDLEEEYTRLVEQQLGG